MNQNDDAQIQLARAALLLEVLEDIISNSGGEIDADKAYAVNVAALEQLRAVQRSMGWG